MWYMWYMTCSIQHNRDPSHSGQQPALRSTRKGRMHRIFASTMVLISDFCRMSWGCCALSNSQWISLPAISPGHISTWAIYLMQKILWQGHRQSFLFFYSSSSDFIWNWLPLASFFFLAPISYKGIYSAKSIPIHIPCAYHYPVDLSHSPLSCLFHTQ